MQLRIQSRDTQVTSAIRMHITDRLRAALDQHADRVRAVTVRLADLNGPRGGIDQVCRVTVMLNNGQALHHERRGLDLYANISLVADKVKRRVGRHMGKLREIKRSRKR